MDGLGFLLHRFILFHLFTMSQITLARLPIFDAHTNPPTYQTCTDLKPDGHALQHSPTDAYFTDALVPKPFCNKVEDMCHVDLRHDARHV